MQGTNQLHLNTATMIEAMQQWLDSKMTNSAPTVTDVKGGKLDGEFVITVSSDVDRPGPRKPA